MTGLLDTLSSPSEVGYGNWRVAKNVVSRSAKNRQKGGGFRRLFADDEVYNNADLHDQLTDQLFYFEQFSIPIRGGGNLSGYSYPYFAPSVETDFFNVFPPPNGPFCPVYIGDFPSGLYNGCTIFYPSVGLPYEYVPALVSETFLRAHWTFDVDGATFEDSVSNLDLTNFATGVTPGLLGNALNLVRSTFDFVQSADATFAFGDVKVGFTGWIQPHDPASGTAQHIIGRWGLAGSRAYRLIITGGQLRFEVSNNGTATTGVTHTHVLAVDIPTFFAVWHDSVGNTINIRVNSEPIVSVAHATGIFSGGASVFTAGEDVLLGLAYDGWMDSLSFWLNGYPNQNELLALYGAGLGMDWPFDRTDICNTGYPSYYLYSALYTSCQQIYGGDIIPGYPYGPGVPVYSPTFSYDYQYCGDQMWSRRGCREAVTLIDEVVTSAGRKLIAGTMSRVYEYNQSSGNWAILASGLGNGGYTSEQCGCNAVRGMTATMGGWLAYTNGVDQPLLYFMGDQPQDCSQQSLTPIADLVALDITKAGGVVSWKGFMIFFDITEGGERKGGTVMWSDLEDPESYIESDTSFAGSETIAVGETILNAAPIGNWLMIYTDKSIIRVTLVGGEDVFNFERIHGSADEDSGSALKYKYSLINTGEAHIYAGQSDVYVFTQFDTRPVSVPWITRAAGFMFNGIVEDDATYNPINNEACELVTGGWSSETREAYISWPTGGNMCPDVTLRLNLKYQVADIVDHGFTAFKAFSPDGRPTVGQWIEDQGICPRGSQVSTRLVDGSVCEPGEPVENPPLYIRNPEEDPDLPVHPESLCARLAGKTMDDYCRNCPTTVVFIGASSADFSLKQLEDAVLYRELLLPGFDESYAAYSCTGHFYEHVGYDAVMQTGAETFRIDDEKMIKSVTIEAEPWAQAIPSDIECEVAYGAQDSCMTWKALQTLSYRCLTEFDRAQHLANKTRPDSRFGFPSWSRGVYLASRFRIPGIGGGGTFSGVWHEVKPWGQHG